MVGERVFDWSINLILVVAAVLVVFPLAYVVSVSLSPARDVIAGTVQLIPTSVTFKAYTYLLSQEQLPRAFAVTLFITVVGTLLNLVLTVLIAYPISRRDLPGRKLLTLMVLFPMVFYSGIIPVYLVVKNLGLLNTVWAMILPNAVLGFNVLIMKSFFEGFPSELIDAARIDGAGELRILWQIVIPLSVPVMMTVGLFYAIGHWNEFTAAILYVQNPELYPLQVVVRNILQQGERSLETILSVPSEAIRMAAVVIASVPIIIVYPFIQRFFTEGALLGSVKE